MKRTILAAIMLAMTVVCAGFLAAAAEQIVLDASAEYTSGGLEITATANNGTDEAKDCTMYFCVFEDDVLRAVRMSEQTVPAGTSSITETISMAQPSEGQSFDIKVFMWDEKMQSETEPAQISYSYLKTNNAISFEAGLFYGFDDRDNILSVYKTIERYDICEYSMSDDWKFIVNGIVTDNEYIYDCFYSDCAPTRKAELADNDGDGEYDELSVDYYVTTAFHSASETGSGTEIYFIEPVQTNIAKITLDTSNKNYIIKNTGGEEIGIEDIRLGNALTVRYNMGMGIEASDFYDITVSDEPVSGFVTEMRTDAYGNTYYVFENNDKRYSVCDDLGIYLFVGEHWGISINEYGEIVYAERIFMPEEFAVVDTVFVRNGDEPVVRIICADGEKRTYAISGTTLIRNNVVAEMWRDYEDVGYVDGVYPLADRIIAYSLNSSEELNVKSYDFTARLEEGTYDINNSTLGRVKIDENTRLLDISSCWNEDDQKFNSGSNAGTVSFDMLIPGQTYGLTVIQPGMLSASPFVLISSGFSGVGRMAIIKDTYSAYDAESGSVIICFDVIENSEEKTLKCVDTSYYASVGDAVLYTLDNDGYVDLIYEISNVDMRGKDRFEYLSGIYNNGIISSDLWELGMYDEFIFAPVIDCDENGITVGSVAYGSEIGDKELTSGKAAYYVDSTQTYEYDDNICAYAMYDNNFRPMFAINAIEPQEVAKSVIAPPSENTASYLDAAGKYINLGMEDIDEQPNRIHFALLGIRGGAVIDVYSIKMRDDDIFSYFTGQ